MSKACAVEVNVITSGDAWEMGLAQGEYLREKIRLSPDVLSQLYSFRVLQPAWMPYPLYRRFCENRATKALETPLQRDFPDAYSRMKGISAGSKINMSLLMLLHALEPMLSDVSRCTVVPDFAACSAVAIRGRRSVTGEPII